MMHKGMIFDVGMHTGKDTEFYLRKGFDVVAIEANPQLVQQTRTRLRQYVENGRLIICEMAVARDDGEIDFYVNDTHKNRFLQGIFRGPSSDSHHFSGRFSCLVCDAVTHETRISGSPNRWSGNNRKLSQTSPNPFTTSLPSSLLTICSLW